MCHYWIITAIWICSKLYGESNNDKTFLEIMTPEQLKQHKCPVLHTGIRFRGPESPCVSGQNCSTFPDLRFINSKMDRLNQKISYFPSSLMFNDSNRKSHPCPYHVLQLNVNKKICPLPTLSFPFFFLYPKMSSSPHDCYRKQY